MSVSERTAHHLGKPGLPAHPLRLHPLDAFIDLRGEPDGLAVVLPPRDKGDESTPAAGHSTATLGDARHLMARYQRLALTADVVSAAAASAVATVLRFGTWHVKSYVALSIAVPVMWVLILAAKRGYEQRYLGRGPEEYRRLWEAGLLLFITMAVLSFSVKGDVARGYVCLVVPLTLVVTAVARTALRKWAARLRRHGLGVQNVLVVGPEPEARGLFERLRDGGVQGLRPIGI